MALSMDRQEYLKRYLPTDSNDIKKKKKKVKIKSKKQNTGFKIIDTDVDIKSITPQNTDVSDEKLVDIGEYAPNVVEFVDEAVDEEEKQVAAAKWRALSPGAQDIETGLKGNVASDHGTKLRDKKYTQHIGNKSQTHRSSAPARRIRHDSDSDQSPPRKRYQSPSPSSDQSPRRKRHDSDSDQSPPRKRHDSDSDQSPRRKIHNVDTDSDQSPPRKGHRSPSPSRKRHDSDQSPPRKRHQSPASTKVRHGSDGDQSPPRKIQQPPSLSRKSHSDVSVREKDTSRPSKMLSGTKAGLQSSDIMKAENKAARQREDRMFTHLPDEVCGRNADTVFRDKKTGKQRDLKEERQHKRKEKEISAEQQKVYDLWKMGMSQRSAQQAALAEYTSNLERPLARYEGDTHLEEMLRARDRPDDPMLAYIKGKKASSATGSTGSRPKYSGPWPPNRFSLAPGYRWDGVNRSNGFEGKLYSRANTRKALEDDAYKWSVEDM